MIRDKKDFNKEEFAQLYIKRHRSLQERLGYQYTKKLNDLGFQKGKILDSGCGFGTMDIVLARQFKNCEITGIDLSVPLLAHANQLKVKDGLKDRVKFMLGDVAKLPFEKDSCDVVFNINMVHWVDSPLKMLEEIRRVLKPNGLLFIKDLRYSWLRLFEFEIKYALKINEAVNLIKEAKLKYGILSKSILWWEYEIHQPLY